MADKMTKYRFCGNIETTVSGKLLYLILSDISNKNGEIIISQRKISDALHISKGAVSRNLRRLRDSGYIDVLPQYHSDGGRAANKYRIK
jgi:predicted transcriptional regulator